MATGAAVATPLVATACSSPGADRSYRAAVRDTWGQHRRVIAGAASVQRELVRYATLAPSSHNTQCWKFAVRPNVVSIVPDLSRRVPVVDPDDHHLFVSLGCAAENLVQAALAHGLHALASVDDVSGTVSVVLESTRAVTSPLFAAIPSRQCTRGDYDGRPVTNDELRLLERAGTGAGVRMLLLTDRAAMERVLTYVVQGNSAQMADAAFVKELLHWIRFSNAEAVLTRDGLFSRASGNMVVPRWLGQLVFPYVFTAGHENDKYAARVRSSAGIAIFVSEANTKAHWVEAGRCYERFALQATALGIRNAFLNQPVEFAALRPHFADSLGVPGLRPDLVVRFGRGLDMPRSLRRPVKDVLV